MCPANQHKSCDISQQLGAEIPHLQRLAELRGAAVRGSLAVTCHPRGLLLRTGHLNSTGDSAQERCRASGLRLLVRFYRRRVAY